MALRPTRLAATHAQSIWLDRVSPKSVHFEMAKILYEADGADDTSEDQLDAAADVLTGKVRPGVTFTVLLGPATP